MEPDELIQHCFRCKGLMVVDPSTIKALPDLLYRAAKRIQMDDIDFGVHENPLVDNLLAVAVLLEMVPDD